MQIKPNFVTPYVSFWLYLSLGNEFRFCEYELIVNPRQLSLNEFLLRRCV